MVGAVTQGGGKAWDGLDCLQGLAYSDDKAWPSQAELEKAIYHWLANWNGDPGPFVWKASADVILDKVRRCRELSKTGD